MEVWLCKTEMGRRKYLKGSLFKKSLLAASTVFVFGAVTAAAQSSNNFTMFFGEEAAGVVENKPTIQEAKIVSGIEMEVEESIIGGKSAIILVSFEKGRRNSLLRGYQNSNTGAGLETECKLYGGSTNDRRSEETYRYV